MFPEPTELLLTGCSTDLETPQEYEIFVESIKFMERVNTRLRIIMNRPPGDRMNGRYRQALADLENVLVFKHERSRFFLGKDYSDILHSIRNT